MSRTHRLIERCFAEDLAPAESDELRTRLRGDAGARQRYDRLRRLTRVAAGRGPDDPSDAELDRLGSALAARLAGDASATARRSRSAGTRLGASWRRLWPAAVAVTAAACAALLFWPRPVQHGTVVMRGLPAAPPLCDIEAYAVSGDDLAGGSDGAPQPRRLTDGDRVHLHDYLQFRYHSADPEVRYLYLFGLDQRMTPLDYYPRPGDAESVGIEPGETASLGRSIRLEKRHQPGPLRVVGLCSRAPLKREAVFRAVATMRAAAWPVRSFDHVPVDGVAQSTMLRLEVVP